MLAYAFAFVFAGSHVCSILQPTVAGQPLPTPMTQAELMEDTHQRCDRPDVGAILVFGAGYVVIAGGAVSWARSR